MGTAILPQSASVVPPSPDRIELKETIYPDELDPPSPGRLVLKVSKFKFSADKNIFSRIMSKMSHPQ